ncbi:MAG: dihydropteroate synthase [Myxococcota bacterium]
MLDFRNLEPLLARHGASLSRSVPGFTIGDTVFDFDRRHLVGVINLSTDSWYKESVCATPAQAIQRGRELAASGAAIIDIGAESSLPHAARRTPQEQLDLLKPVVESLTESGLLVSVESYHPEVLLRTAEVGAKVFNLTGMKEAQEVFALAARFDCAVILCYVQGEHVRSVGDFQLERDMVPKLLDYFRDLLSRANAMGVTKCFIDPGLGFYYRNLQDSALRVTHQIDTFLNAFRLWELEKPVFNILPHAPEAFGPRERRAAEPFFAVLACLGGTHVIRTHEVEKVRRVLDALELYQP